ncbi:chloroperoxidase [Echria macrotheca]|uniref:Chloroperoxidase n=1 Tax=Echria macrotheca TaxID=438768 RepID=A0AAJ0B8S7_9PEZI|nr:chloroperoxidase [Echria macrotheca]
MLNSLANHGFIARSGRNISIDELVGAIDTALNLDPASSRPVAELAATTSTTGNPNTFHLSDMDKHGVIEHDGSLSRNDIYFGDNHSFNPKIFATAKSFFDQHDVISIETAAKARRARLTVARAANPTFNFTAREDQFSQFESALYLAVFGTGTQGNAPTKWVETMFCEERIPYKEGFTRPTDVITNDDIVTLANLVAAAA